MCTAQVGDALRPAPADLREECLAQLRAVQEAAVAATAEPLARDIALAVAKVTCSALLVAQSAWSGRPEDWAAVQRFSWLFIRPRGVSEAGRQATL